MRTLILAVLLFTSACTVQRAVMPGLQLPKERATECEANCASLDMRLSAIVVVMSHVGCVCEPRGGTASSSSGPAAAAAEVVIEAVAQQQHPQSAQSLGRH